MGNSLGRTIVPGELIVLSQAGLKPEYQAIEHRILVAKSGFGLQAFTMGKAIYAQDLFDRTEYRWDGYQFDKEETEALKVAIIALKLWRNENQFYFLKTTNDAPWAQDVCMAALIWDAQTEYAQAE